MLEWALLLYWLGSIIYVVLLGILSPKLSLTEKLIRLLLLAAVPFVGAILLAISLTVRGRRKGDMNALLTVHAVEDAASPLSKIRRINAEQERNIAPIEEVLLINDKQIKRRMLIDVLKNDTIHYIGILQQALGNEDTETSHYAAAAVMDMKGKLQVALQELAVKYDLNKSDKEIASAYAEVLKIYISSGFLDERSLLKVRYSYMEVLRSRIASDGDTDGYYGDLVNLEIDLGRLDLAQETARAYLDAYPQDERPFVLMLKVRYLLKDHAGFQATLAALKRSPIRLSNSTLSIVRYWSEGVR